MTLTEKQEFEILRMTAGHYFTDIYPENWDELTDEEAIKWAEDHTWSILEYVSPKEVIDACYDAAHVTIAWIKNNL